jgi:hypothetical protein
MWRTNSWLSRKPLRSRDIIDGVRRDDPDEWDWEEPRPLPAPQPPVVVPPERSPYAPSFGTKLAAVLAFLLLVPGGLAYFFRYDLGIAKGTYKFMAVQPGTDDIPVTYQSCQPIKYVVNSTLSVPGGQQFIDEAVGRISAATGLRFVNLGTTNLVPGRGRTPGATILIAWTTPTQVPELAGDTVGVGGSSSVRFRDSARRFYFSGEISLDTPDLADMLERNGPASVRAVVMHELGHVMGLDHVQDRHELMNEHNVGMTDFGPGDLAGLALLGKGGCEGNL